VLPTINLDDHLVLEASEVDDISPDRRLPPDLRITDLAIAQAIPKALFGLGCIDAQLAGDVAHGISVS
jgi:hypothetical protein